ncbi:MAG: glycosyltransferase [Nitrospirales bacterium]|nr:glycosyltransferase [Nitrospirales bacterium]
MRVLAVTNIYPTLAHPTCGTFVEQQVKGIMRIGVDVEVIYLNRIQEGVKVYRGLGCKIEERIKLFNPDVVHVMYGGIMADLVTKAITIRPTVVTFHGSDLLGQNLSGIFRKMISRCGVYASWRAAWRAHGVIVVSKVLQDALPKFVNQSKVRIIPCGIDFSRFKTLDRKECRDHLGWDPNCFTILFNGNSADPVKRPSLARHAMDILVKNLGISAKLQELRCVPNEEVPIWMNASNVVLLTSLHEGSPTVIKEALACNVPIVSVDVGDVREQIREIEGCYIALSTPEDLAAKLELVSLGSGRVESRQRMQKLSIESIAHRVAGFYQELLSNNE